MDIFKGEQLCKELYWGLQIYLEDRMPLTQREIIKVAEGRYGGLQQTVKSSSPPTVLAQRVREPTASKSEGLHPCSTPLKTVIALAIEQMIVDSYLKDIYRVMLLGSGGRGNIKTRGDPGVWQYSWL